MRRPFANRGALLAGRLLLHEPTIQHELRHRPERDGILDHPPTDAHHHRVEPGHRVVSHGLDQTSGLVAAMKSMVSNEASSHKSSAVGKYRYTVATETDPRSAASGTDGGRPSRTSSIAAARSAAHVRAFWLTRPVFVKDDS